MCKPYTMIHDGYISREDTDVTLKNKVKLLFCPWMKIVYHLTFCLELQFVFCWHFERCLLYFTRIHTCVTVRCFKITFSY